ncbi:MAG: cold shock domain-containing protein [Crocinitomicaceae bacterium]|nr:cold shock domain-containing protein [Crocinitomicaceae bacterium]
MSKSRESWNKKEMENLRKKKKDDKAKRKLEKKVNTKDGGKKSFEDMIAYVDENGMITSTAPDLTQKKKVIDADSIEISTPRQVAGEEEVEELRTGKVAFFNTSKGYGFIKDGVKNESFFVHMNDLLTPIKENDTVTFKVEAAQRGLKVVEVQVVAG